MRANTVIPTASATACTSLVKATAMTTSATRSSTTATVRMKARRLVG